MEVNEFEGLTSITVEESLNTESDERPSPTMSVTNKHAGICDRFVVQDHISVHIENMLSSMPPPSPERSIFRVHHQLREVNEKAYEPVILAIGPYHHGNGKFKFMEEQKLRYLQQLLKRRNEGTVDRYVLTLRELEQRARKCYAETIDLSQEKFLAMMLIDGCFIVELFRKCKTNIPTDKEDWLQYSLRRDLLLLENQLPLFVLSKLYDLTKDPGDRSEFGFYASVYFRVPIENLRAIGEETEHLLHLYHTWCTSGLPEKPLLPRTLGMPSAIELKESGVRFRFVKGRHLGDIKFENGTLEIPVLILEDDTESEFRNLIAYEQHRRNRVIDYFADYAIFMDYLINSSKDVKVLRRAGIIDNCLGDDEVVARMFNKMCDNIISTHSFYSEIFKNLNAHCKKRRNVWMAKLRREYFHSPWALLSVVAAIVLLLLTAAQTIYTVLSYTK